MIQLIIRYLFTTLFVFAGTASVTAQVNFIENKGQWDGKVKFRANASSASFFLEQDGFKVAMYHPDDLKIIGEQMHGHLDKKAAPPGAQLKLRSHAYKVSFFGANRQSLSQPHKPANTYNNYYLGADPAKWATNCKIYNEVVYHNVYPKIDVRFYTTNEQLKYDFIVQPGGNPNVIGLRYDGVEGLDVVNNELFIKTSVGTARELSPYTYQPGATSQNVIDCKYVLEDNVISFKVKDYDRTKPLIIDPTIIFSTFTGSTADNWGYTATPGADGSFYAGGISFGTGYPVSTGAYDGTFNGGVPQDGLNDGYDIAIMKFSPNGSQRLYGTYIGGSRNEQPHSMIVDGAGNLIVAGASNSQNYPQAGLSGFAEAGTNYDIIITKFNGAGSALIGSAKIGGSGEDGINIGPKYMGAFGPSSLRQNYGDDARSEVITDAAGNIILASCTRSANFPAVGTPLQPGLAGAQDGVILKLTPSLNAITFSSYFGGTGDDACFVAAINPTNNNIYIGGSSLSPVLPGNTTNVLSPGNNGSTDGFVIMLTSAAVPSILKTTFIGTSALDMLFGLKFDRVGFPYVMGTTLSNSWPVVNAAYSNASGKQYITKLQPDLSGIVYSTTLGNASTRPNLSPIAFLVDRCENVYISGWGGGINADYGQGSTASLPVVNPLSGLPNPDGADFYFFVLERNASTLLFASHYGQNGGTGDHVDGGTSRFDEQGIIYQAICANCGRDVPFPTTGGVWAPVNGSPRCNEAALKIDMNFAGVAAGIQSEIDGVQGDTLLCIGKEVTLRDIRNKGKKYIFDFGDGSPQVTVTAPANSATHTYATAGTYLAFVIAEDSSTCNIRDTSYITLRVGDNQAALNFNFAKLPPCESLTYQFTNTTTSPTGSSFLPQNFYWDYGDGSPRDTINGFAPNPATHTYAAPGTYDVTLFLYKDNFCNAPDSFTRTIRINPTVEARFSAETRGCVPFVEQFTNESLGGETFQWQFDNGTIFSTDENPQFTFTTPGTYRVRLIATDPSTCNIVDTSDYLTIEVFPIPVANASFSPNPPIENVPVTFTNLSSPDAVSFLWLFGDGESSTVRNPVHEYNQTGTYAVQLIASNIANCTDTFELDVPVLVLPLLDVPNAFTPGKFGENSIVKVRGFGIQKMTWRIYNRWGENVFTSTVKNTGWDGTYKGKLQPMDVYTYTLDAELVTGEKIRKTGDITLLR